jgi:hypothetical protein
MSGEVLHVRRDVPFDVIATGLILPKSFSISSAFQRRCAPRPAPPCPTPAPAPAPARGLTPSHGAAAGAATLR